MVVASDNTLASFQLDTADGKREGCFWLLSLPVGFVAKPVMPGNAWISMLNSLAVATFVYAIVWLVTAVPRVVQHCLVSGVRRR